MMSYIQDDAIRQRLMRECQCSFPDLPENVVLAVLHEHGYDLASASRTLARYDNDIRHSQAPIIPLQAPQQPPAYYLRTANPYGPPTAYSPYPSPPPLSHSQSDPLIRNSYRPSGLSPSAQSDFYQSGYQQSNSPASYSSSPTCTTASSSNRASSPNPYNRSPSPRSYHQSINVVSRAYPHTPAPRQPMYTSQRTNTSSTNNFGQKYQHEARMAPMDDRAAHGQQLYIDVSGDAGMQYHEIDGALATPVLNVPQQCTDPLSGGYFPISSVSPIDMRVPQLPFPLLPATNADGSRSTPPFVSRDAGHMRPTGQDETAYAQALILHQRARMSKLHKHLLDRKQTLDLLSKEVLDKETQLLRRNNERARPIEMAKLTEANRKLQVQIQLLSQEIDHYNYGAVPLGMVDPQTQENFHRSITEMGQCGPMRLPDTSNHGPVGEGEVRYPEDGEPWDCRICTFRNHPALDHCETCEFPRNARLPI